MQVLKSEIRENIIRVSEVLFYKYGFEKASMREIAKGVNISVSNLYKYFKNKEDIFDEIIKSFYINYRQNFLKFTSHKEDDTFGDNRIAHVSHALFESIKGKNVKFVILMDKSKGTKYAGFKNEIISHLEYHIRDGVSEINRRNFMINVFARNFFYGIIEIANNYKNDEWALTNMSLLVEYHFKGISILYK